MADGACDLQTRTIQRICLARRARGLSQQALADASGLRRDVIANIETGRRSSLSIAEAAALAKGLGLGLVTLLGDEPITISRDVRVIE